MDPDIKSKLLQTDQAQARRERHGLRLFRDGRLHRRLAGAHRRPDRRSRRLRRELRELLTRTDTCDTRGSEPSSSPFSFSARERALSPTRCCGNGACVFPSASRRIRSPSSPAPSWAVFPAAMPRGRARWLARFHPLARLCGGRSCHCALRAGVPDAARRGRRHLPPLRRIAGDPHRSRRCAAFRADRADGHHRARHVAPARCGVGDRTSGGGAARRQHAWRCRRHAWHRVGARPRLRRGGDERDRHDGQPRGCRACSAGSGAEPLRKRGRRRSLATE